MGEAVAGEDVAEVAGAGLGLTGVSNDFKMSTLPLVSSSARCTSSGKFVITLLFDLNFSGDDIYASAMEVEKH